MQLNSLQFVTFFLVIFVGHWVLLPRRAAWQNSLLAAANAFFLASWDVRALGLFAGGALLDFILSHFIFRTQSTTAKRGWIAAGVAWNLVLLAWFKYFNFFLGSLPGTENLHAATQLIIPIGISFITFLRIGYLIDVFRGQTPPPRNPISFFTFTTFFPAVISGPIERSSNLLAQLEKPRLFDTPLARDGLRRIVGGVLKKVVVADALEKVVRAVFEHPERYSGGDLAIGILAFSIQIYCDFSGYSDLAIGVANLLGIRLLENFRFPYFSRDIAEFWRRWHISLSTWFRDYLFLPLGGGYHGKPRWIINTLVTFGLCGLWHGAGWNFIAWGIYLAVVMTPVILRAQQPKRSRVPAGKKILPDLREFFAIAGTFLLVMISWVFFRSDSIGHAFTYFSLIVTQNWWVAPTLLPALGMSLMVLLWEWLRKNRVHAFDISDLPVVVRWLFYGCAVAGILFFGQVSTSGFIYAQF